MENKIDNFIAKWLLGVVIFCYLLVHEGIKIEFKDLNLALLTSFFTLCFLKFVYVFLKK